VDLHVQLRGVQDDRPHASRELRRLDQLQGLVRDALGVAGEVEAADELVAGGSPATPIVGVAAPLVLVAIDGVGLKAAAGVGDQLLDIAAVGRREDLVLALRGIERLGEREALHTPQGLIGREEIADLRLERDRERVLLDRRLVAPRGRRPIVEQGGIAQRGRRRAGDAHGLGGDPVGVGGRQAMG
jgi:hypothetical protein